MSVLNFFRELAIQQAPTQQVLVDALTEESPIFANMPMQEASNGIQNVYEELKDVEGAQVVDLDSELPLVDANGELKYKDLAVLGGLMNVGEDKAKKMGGPAAYFNRKLPPVLRVTGANVEKSFIYNTVLPYARTNSREQLAGGSDENSNFSMFAIKWVSGETTGLYDPTGFGNGKVFDMTSLYGGQLCQIDDGSGNTIPGYSMRIKNYIGFQLANPRYVASIRNINPAIDTDPTSLTGRVAIPTEAEIDDMLEQCRANPANTIMYMHPKVLNALKVYKGGALEMSPTDMDFNRAIDNWNGIPIVTSYNFIENEAVVSAP